MKQRRLWLIMVGIIGSCLIWVQPSQAISSQAGFEITKTQIVKPPVDLPEIPSQGQVIEYQAQPAPQSIVGRLPQLGRYQNWLWFVIGLELVIISGLLVDNRRLARARKVGN